MFKIGLSGQMFDELSIWDHLKAAVEFGYYGVELRSTHVSPQVPREELEKIHLYIKDNDLTVIGLSCFVGNYGLLSDEDCEKAYEVFKQYVELACLMEAETVRVWSGWQESSAAPLEVWERAAYWMIKSAAYANEFDKKIVMEMHHGTLCDTADSALRLLNMIKRMNVGVTLDPVNMYQVPTDYGRAAIRKLGHNIFNVHIKDIIQLTSADYPYSFAYSYYAKHIGRFTEVRPPSIAEERYYCHRRINHGGIDWATVLRGLEDIGYNGYLVVESVCETNQDMPFGTSLAKVCHSDVKALQKGHQHDKWAITSPKKWGLNEVISPEKSECSVVRAYRLNLSKGDTYVLNTENLEMNAVLVRGEAHIESNRLSEKLEKLDSFYVPGQTAVYIEAKEDCTFYIGAAPCEGIGEQFFRKFQADVEEGEIYQIHGEGIFAREVFFTLNPQVPASRLICGITRGGMGAWTSWPPHQHEKDLEEIYCYFDIPKPDFGLHVSYTDSGKPRAGSVHVVGEGDMVLAPKGCHPTVACPASKNTYFWILASFTPESRRYDLAKPDPFFA